LHCNIEVQGRIIFLKYRVPAVLIGRLASDRQARESGLRNARRPEALPADPRDRNSGGTPWQRGYRPDIG